jgi:autotransporter translocation and assembly factor TamB
MTKKKNIVRKTISWIIWLILVLILCCIACLMFFSLSPGEIFIKGILETQLAKLIGNEVRIDNFETNLLSRIKFENINIHEKTTGEKKSSLKIHVVKINYNIFTLFNNKLSIKKIAIDSLHFNINKDSLGFSNFFAVDSTKEQPSASSQSDIKLEIGELSLINSSLCYKNELASITSCLFNLNLHAENDIKDTYHLIISADSLNLVYEDIPASLKNAQIRGLWNSKKWELETFSFFHPELEITAKGDGNFSSFNYAELNIIGNTNHLSQYYKKFIPDQVLPMEGNLKISLFAKGKFVAPEVLAEIEAPLLKLGTINLTDGFINCRWHKAEFELTGLKINLFDGQISGEAMIFNDSLSNSYFNLNVNNINSGKLWQTYFNSESTVTGLIEGKINARGKSFNIKNWQVSTNLLLSKMFVQNQYFPDIKNHFTLNKGLVEFLLNQGKSEIIIQAELINGKIEGDFFGKISDVTPFVLLATNKDVEGQLQFNGNIKGNQSAPLINANFLGSNIKFQNFPVDSIDGQLTFKDNNLFFPKLYCFGHQTKIDSSNAPFHLTSMQGGFNYFVTAAGSLNNLQANMDVELFSPTYDQVNFDHGFLSASLKDHKIQLKTFNLTHDSVLINIAAKYYLKADSGRANLGFYSTGNKSINPNELKELQNYFSTRFKNLGKITSQFQLEKENNFDVYKTNGKIIGNHLELTLLKPFLPEKNHLTGIGDFNFFWDGTVESARLKGSLTIDEGALILAEKGQPLISYLDAYVSIQDTVLNIHHITGEFEGKPLKLYGQIVVKQKDYFGIDLNMNISDAPVLTILGLVNQDSIFIDSNVDSLSLSLMQSFVPDLKGFSGILNSDISISGKPTNPEVVGDVRIYDLSAQIPMINSKLNQGIVKINFDKQNIFIDSVYAKLNNGEIFLNGDLSFYQGKINNINLTTKMENITINRPEEFILNVRSSVINYKNKENYYLLDGAIVLGESKFLYNIRPGSFLTFAKTVERPKPEYPDFFKKTKFDIRLKQSENIWIDNNLARVRLHPELSIIGTPVNIYLGGRLIIEEGYVLYLDRKFNISKGLIDFINPNRMNPLIDIQAKAKLKSYQTLVGTQYEITLGIIGPLDQPIVSLTSEPSLEKADILSLLTFGVTGQQMTSSEINGKETTAKQIFVERAKTYSSNRISGYAERRLGKSLGLEKITIEGNLLNFKKTWGPQLLASKKLSDRVELIYTTTVGHMNEQNIRLGYKLSKKFFIEGQTDQRGRSAIDLKYKLKLK